MWWHSGQEGTLVTPQGTAWCQCPWSVPPGSPGWTLPAPCQPHCQQGLGLCQFFSPGNKEAGSCVVAFRAEGHFGHSSGHSAPALPHQAHLDGLKSEPAPCQPHCHQGIGPHQFSSPGRKQAASSAVASGTGGQPGHSSGHSTVPVPLLCPSRLTWMDSKVRTPFSQALRISRMAAEMLRQASCHFICLAGREGGPGGHSGWGSQSQGGWGGCSPPGSAPAWQGGCADPALTPASSPRSC